MKREYLINGGLIVCILLLTFLIFSGGGPAHVEIPKSTAGADASSPTRPFASDPSSSPYKHFGTRDLFKPLLTPTPSPTPTPTPPPKTPDIMVGLAPYRVTGIMDGSVSFENTKPVQNPETGETNQFIDLKVGQTFLVDVGGGVMKTATVKQVDESSLDNPRAIISLEGTTYEKLYEPYKDGGTGSLQTQAGGALSTLLPVLGATPAGGAPPTPVATGIALPGLPGATVPVGAPPPPAPPPIPK